MADILIVEAGDFIEFATDPTGSPAQVNYQVQCDDPGAISRGKPRANRAPSARSCVKAPP
jgi:hypothetical protein